MCVCVRDRLDPSRRRVGTMKSKEHALDRNLGSETLGKIPLMRNNVSCLSSQAVMV